MAQSKKHIKNDYEFNVQPEHFKRPESLEFITRFDEILNLSAIARKLPSCPHTNTLVSRLNRISNLQTTVDQRAFAQEIGELFNEVFWEIGVGLGHFPKDPHKKYRYLFTGDHDRLKDRLSELEETQMGSKK